MQFLSNFNIEGDKKHDKPITSDKYIYKEMLLKGQIIHALFCWWLLIFAQPCNILMETWE